jgi:hypothetical protein
MVLMHSSEIFYVGIFRKEPSDDPNTVFHGSFTLQSIGSGKVGVRPVFLFTTS